jgi:two-component system response regulator YesN
MEDISLVTAAEHVHMNHIYISRLIKKETGETFLDILTGIRMKKACELLANTDYKTYEISYKIGINDCNYFSQVFKKNLGVTPSEYRENLSKRQKNSKEADV